MSKHETATQLQATIIESVAAGTDIIEATNQLFDHLLNNFKPESDDVEALVEGFNDILKGGAPKTAEVIESGDSVPDTVFAFSIVRSLLQNGVKFDPATINRWEELMGWFGPIITASVKTTSEA